MAQVIHNVFLCDKSWNKLATLQYQNLQYSRLINGTGQAYFEMQIQNPVFDKLGFDFIENTYNIQIERSGIIVFRGELDEVGPADTGQKANDALGVMDRIGIYASHKIDQFRNIIITPDAGSEQYVRTFTNISIGTAVQTIVQEAIARTNSPLSDVTIGDIENPLDSTGAELKFTADQQFIATDTLTFIDVCSVIGNCDYWLDETNKFHFVKCKGVVQPNAIFRLHFGEPGNNLSSLKIETSKRDIANKILVIGAGEGIVKKLGEDADTSHQTKYGLKERVVAARTLDTTATAGQYAKTKLTELKSPNKLVVFTPSQSHEPLQGFSLGDVISVDIKWFIYNFTKQLRVLGVTCYVDQQTAESYAYQLTTPRESQLS